MKPEESIERPETGPPSLQGVSEVAADNVSYQPFPYRTPHRSLSSWLMSFGIHGLLIGLILFALYQIPKGFGEEEIVTGSIVLVADSTEKNEKVYLDQSDVENPNESEDAAASAAAAQAVSQKMPELDDLPDLPGMQTTDDAATQATQQHQGSTGVGQMAVPTNQNGGGNIGQKEVRFGGVRGTGSRFVYVVDRSASMGDQDSKLMQAAKAELEASLSSLTELQQFQIIFYNDEWEVFQREAGPLKMYEGTEANVDQALRYAEGVRPGGGTRHAGPILQALAMGADVIFLLTDADNGLKAYELNEIRKANHTNATISVIVYGPTDAPTAANETFRRLTRETRGTFAFKSVSSVGR